MTVTYASQVSSSKGVFSAFLILLFKWKGSIYKLIWKDLLIFITLYYAINLSYRFWFNPEMKRRFDLVQTHCKEFSNFIPLSFVLGFYVTQVVGRWWEQLKSIPVLDNLSILISASVKGRDEESCKVRRSVIRYGCLTYAITLSMISPQVKRRFPTLDFLVNAGLMMPDEKEIYEKTDNDYPGYSKNWIPLEWAANVVTNARAQGIIKSDPSVAIILQEINKFRGCCGTLLDYDWISIPLVYTQVVTIAVYSYFITTILARQQVAENEDFYFPFLPVLEFFFYMGWLKVAETMINPFGDDDDDFEMNWLIDRNVVVSYLMVNKERDKYPALMNDKFWESKIPSSLPHTVASKKSAGMGPTCSTSGLRMTKKEQRIRDENGIDGNRRNRLTFRRFFTKQNRNVSIDLEAIQNETPLITIQEVNHNEINNDTTIGSGRSFEELKEIRRLKMRAKVKNCLRLMRQENVTEIEEDSILDEIL